MSSTALFSSVSQPSGRCRHALVKRVFFILSADSNANLFLKCPHRWWCSVAQSCPTLCDPWTAGCQASLSSTISYSSLKLMPIELMTPSNHLILCCPLLLPSTFPSIRILSNESTLHTKWPQYQNFSYSNSPSNECSGWISFRIECFDIAVQLLSIYSG